MISEKKILAIIPARYGSKGLPGKNHKLLCGTPLIGWSIKAGLKSKYIDELIVSTDSKEIADIALAHGAKVPFLRPSELAGDCTTSVEVVMHALNYYSQHLKIVFDYIVLLEPTSPLREADDIDCMLAQLDGLEHEFDGIVSLGVVNEHPSIMKGLRGKEVMSYYEGMRLGGRRQDNEPAYFPYGVAYIMKTSSFMHEKTFYPQRLTYHQIKRYQCYEIDDIYDFLAVENIMRYEWDIK